MRIVGRTDQGKVRTNNEDFFAIDDRVGLAVLADGMGGLNAGEIASERAVTCVIDTFRAGLRVDPMLDLDARAQLLEGAVHAANALVFDLGQSRFDYHGMGTTLVAAALHGNRCAVAHVGDSRVYRYRGRRLSQVSVDHSVVQQLVEEGVLSPAEARRAPNRNVVTRAVGIDVDVKVDIEHTEVNPGDLLLLCSDGLSDIVEHEHLESCIASHLEPSLPGSAESAGSDADGPSMGQLADALIDIALAGGGTDNVSVVLIAP